jgi:hypothetical protein
MYRGTGTRNCSMIEPDRDSQLIRVPIYRWHHAVATLMLGKRPQMIGDNQ